MIDIAELNRRMCDFATARLDAMGPDAGGLANYYARRVQGGAMLTPAEIAVAEYIDSLNRGPVLELCAGAAQLGHLLSLIGQQVSAVEIDKRRHAFAVALGAHVGSTCEILFAGWQELSLSNWRLLVTLNAVTSHIFPADTKWLRDHARVGGEFIIRPRQFGPGIDVEIPGLKATKVFEDVYHYTAA